MSFTCVKFFEKLVDASEVSSPTSKRKKLVLVSEVLYLAIKRTNIQSRELMKPWERIEKWGKLVKHLKFVYVLICFKYYFSFLITIPLV